MPSKHVAPAHAAVLPARGTCRRPHIQVVTRTPPLDPSASSHDEELTSPAAARRRSAIRNQPTATDPPIAPRCCGLAAWSGVASWGRATTRISSAPCLGEARTRATVVLTPTTVETSAEVKRGAGGRALLAPADERSSRRRSAKAEQRSRRGQPAAVEVCSCAEPGLVQGSWKKSTAWSPYAECSGGEPLLPLCLEYS